MDAQCRHLLIDGYNVIHSWPRLRKYLRRGGEVARARLVEQVRVLHDVEGIRVTIVFDGRGDDIEIERPTPDLTFSVIFSPRGLSADGVIEQLVGTARSPESIQVSTRDNLMRETVRALGAESLSPEELEARIQRCEKQMARNLERQQAGVERAWRRRE